MVEAGGTSEAVRVRHFKEEPRRIRLQGAGLMENGFFVKRMPWRGAGRTMKSRLNSQ
jgi:hypothetical protein